MSKRLTGMEKFSRGVSKAWRHARAVRTTKEWILCGGAVVALGIALLLVTFLTPYQTHKTVVAGEDPSGSYQRARVVETPREKTVRVKLLDGANKGDFEIVAYSGQSSAEPLRPGETVIIGESTRGASAMFYFDRYRIPALALLLCLFVVLVVLVGGKQGLASIIGLFVSVLVIGWGIIPLIMKGWDAFMVSLIGAYVIAIVSVLISHGIRRRTFISIVCIVSILTMVAVLAYLAVIGAFLTGVSDETAYYLSLGETQLDMRGMIIGGIVIASLGVLDDVVTTQVATVEKIYEANPQQERLTLFKAASSVGGEHIASLVNTLALAYVGASLPLIIAMTVQSRLSPVMVINSEYIATEVVRTLAASVGLVLAVPLSTLVATMLYTHKKSKPPRMVH